MDSFQKNSLTISKICFFLFIGSLFFPIRYVFFTNSAFQTGAYSDFTSFSLYLSDILLFLLFLSIIVPRGKEFIAIVKSQLSIAFFIFWLILAIIWHFNTFSSLNWYFLLKYAELIVAYGTISVLFKDLSIKKAFFWLFASLTGVQSLLALWQFIIQKSVGLKILGEQVLSPQILGVAKIVSGGTKLIRGYGTFPHPNLLSAFLVAGILITVYLMLKASKKWAKLLLGFLLFLNIMGLAITFSRSAYLALGIAAAIFFGYLLVQIPEKMTKRKVGAILMIFCGSAIISFLLFRPYILTRATITDQASIERSTYNKIGLQLIKDHPLFGTGIGESVLHMGQYSGIKLEPWQKQPIHNYFLLAAAELGIPGALILIWTFLFHLFGVWNLKISKLFKNWKLEIRNLQLNLYHLTLSTIVLAFLVLMMFDHYFYTLQQTQMLLWAVLGMIADETQNPSAKI
jgi:O-antigen ligase